MNSTLKTFLALDWGQKRTGLATADPSGTVITPRGHLKRAQNLKRWELAPSDISQLKKFIEDYEIGQIILGLPKLREDKDTRSSKGAKELARALKDVFQLEVILVDESFTSRESQGAQDNDAQAAAIMLRDYFSGDRPQEKGFIKILLVLIILLASVLGFLFYRFEVRAHAPNKGSYTIDVAPGYSFPKIFPQLGLNDRLDILMAKAWLKMHGGMAKLKVGEFLISGNSSFSAALNSIINGIPIQHTLTHKEGNNIWDLEIVFKEKFPNLDRKSYQKYISKITEIEDLKQKIPDSHKTLEGFLFPETYSYQKYQGPDVLIKLMLTQFKKRALPILKEHFWAEQDNGIYRLLTLASIVEKESGNFEEQPLIASVFWNRLKKKMRLQSDPTSIYPLLPDFDGNLKRIHLETLNEYNTYKIPELPVGPICNPGESAIKAVVHPAETDYLYFVAKNDGSGTHAFSTDYETHSKYVKQYQLKK
jgi:UPF0755 protein